MPSSRSATRQHSTIVAGSPGSRSNARTVGRRMSSARASDVCSSRSARLASHASVARSSQTTNSIVFDPVGTPAVCTHSGRCDGAFFS